MKKLVTLIVIGLLLGFSGSARAAGCDNPKPGFDEMYCIWQLLVQADKDMNDAYKELRTKLNANGQKLLRTSQLAWLAKRDRAAKGEINGREVWYSQTVTEMTQERTKWLKARIRECNSTGCELSKLK
jgi:uncharacterized protein YecT (DUF1311 family)